MFILFLLVSWYVWQWQLNTVRILMLHLLPRCYSSIDSMWLGEYFKYLSRWNWTDNTFSVAFDVDSRWRRRRRRFPFRHSILQRIIAISCNRPEVLRKLQKQITFNSCWQKMPSNVLLIWFDSKWVCKYLQHTKIRMIFSSVNQVDIFTYRYWLNIKMFMNFMNNMI